MSTWILFLGLALVPNLTWAMTFDSLQHLIQENHINSIEALLPLLPESYRSRYALMFRSRSLHEASYKDPRVLMYGSDASLIVSFNGASDQKGFDALETMEFDEKKNEFYFREILFPKTQNGVERVSFSKSNPEKCLECHGQSVRPIWDTHPLWPGAYGERYHSLLSPQEQEGIEKFSLAQPSHSRYKYLAKSDLFKNKETFYPSTQNRYEGSVRESPNEELSRLLSNLNVRRIVKAVRESKNFASYRFALLASLNRDCESIEHFVPESSRSNFLEKYKLFLILSEKKNEVQDHLKKTRSVALDYQPTFGGRTEQVSFASFRFLAEQGLGLSTDEWTTALEVGTFDFTAPQNIEAEMENQVLRRVAESDPTLQKLASLRNVSSSDKYCSYLRKQSVISLEAASNSAPDRGERKPSAILAKETPVLPVVENSILLQKCVSCHLGAVGPKIPFGQTDSLVKLLSQGTYPRGSLYHEILYRLSPASGADRMPRGVNLSDEERQNIEKYLEALKNRGEAKRK